MIVVSDTSPVLNLALIGRLDLLASLYGQVLIPPAVHQELTGPGKHTAVVEPGSCPWLVVECPQDEARIHELRNLLDRGEAEAIVLAWERRADLLLVDERRGRQVASFLGLSITGLLGVLAEAKRARLIERVQPVLDDLIGRAGFWIRHDLYTRVLAELGEG